MKWEREESQHAWLPSGEYFRDTGVFRSSFESGLEIAGVSANSWEEYLEYLSRLSPTDKYVVSPELITCAGMDFEALQTNKDLINQRIDSVVNLSNNFGDSYFLLGTPLFVNKKPRNSVLVIKNGVIVGVTNKRYGATVLENEFFEMIPEETPLLLPETQTPIVICSDLALASLYVGKNENLDEILKISGRIELIDKHVEVLPSSSKSILVVAGWAVGGRFVEDATSDMYYKNQLIGISARVMRYTNVVEVLIVDRVPTNLPEEIMRLTPTKPYNGVIRSR